ncbi:hemolysin family protein [Glaesserella parasuis]|uniref:hemolysin family protein n=1 Tax=Glaesserella parasuis TaxID=738 RepID=UPI0021BD50A1|nr:hemolysin family protein [Glaesserella parasuis]MCT8579323.1 hemolysin family protein [Glaesserella parasuis]MCT8593394.1 hemolysin family protein [Glaesserella parasuis]MCT8716695.1 hemolysin family protein [Glaesserella parasuis]MCT8718818.1 hemolysin family protein [Glaesserella parasuis]MCT8722989.1 hemolysin family protein [Glaesserella parasuis]
MGLSESISIIILLVIASAIISAGEISLASVRKLKLQNLINEGNEKAQKVLKFQEEPPGQFITVVQIAQNVIAVLGGMFGEGSLTPYIYRFLSQYSQVAWLETASSWISFTLVTVAFIIFSDLIPKRLAIANPEKVAMKMVNLMSFSIILFKPFVLLLDPLANALFRLFRIPTVREETMTSDDIVAIVDAGAEAGVLKAQEHYLIENIFDMQQRTVTSTMTIREHIVFLDKSFNRQQIIETLKENSHSKLIITDGSLDKILGYVESHTLLTLYLQEENVKLIDSRVLRKALFIPDTLSLFEVLELFKSSGEDFAVIINEYALVVGIVTLNDVMSIVMGELVSNEEEQIVRRDEDSWLVDGSTPLEDVMRALDIEAFPNQENYETISGFMMYMLRKVPKKTDFVLYNKYKFEIIDTENFKIDQLMVSFRKDRKSEE